MHATAQLSFFGGDPPSFDATSLERRRRELSGRAWIVHAPNWLRGHESLFEALVREVPWQSHRRNMYDRVVDVPRLVGSCPPGSTSHALLERIAGALSGWFERDLSSVTLAYYRDGRDSVAPHGDRLGALVDDAVVATVSVGEPRRFTLRPVEGKGGVDFALGTGDLLVMGGACQRTWRHAVPKVARAGPRIAIMFRPRIPDAERRAGAPRARTILSG